MTPTAIDFSQFVDLRRVAGEGDSEALREVAGQFEALFIQTLLKNMRDASLGDGLFGDSEEHKMYESMLDQQLALEMASGKGIGIAEMLVRQLGGEPAETRAEPTPAAPSIAPSIMSSIPPATAPRSAPRYVPQTVVPAASETSPAATKPAATPSEPDPDFDTPESFVRELWPHVKRVASELKVEARAILAQAALETGWGRHVPSDPSGRSSFNLFGIKADSRWSGDAVAKPTIEFDNGVARQERARFRAYDSIADSVRDYVDFLRGNPRYSGVAATDGTPKAFGQSLADAGYATDPDYAKKIDRVADSEPMRRALRSLQGETPSTGRAGGFKGPW